MSWNQEHQGISDIFYFQTIHQQPLHYYQVEEWPQTCGSVLGNMRNVDKHAQMT